MPSHPDAQLLAVGPSRRGWHRIQTAAECLQKYAWNYEAPRPETQKDPLIYDNKAPPLVKGSLLHLAMAHRYTRMMLEQQGKDPDTICEPMEAVALVATLNDVKPYISLIGGAYEYYDDRNRGEIDRKKILEVESLNEIVIQDKYLLTGRLDLVYEDNGGQIWVTDHKSAGRITASHKDNYAISGQMFGYTLMARRKYGDRLAGMKINLVELSTTPKFELISLPRSPFMESHFEQSLVDIEERIEAIRVKKRPYAEWPKSMSELVCVTRYGECPFLHLCRFGADVKPGGDWTWEG